MNKKLAASILGVALMATPAFAFALTLEDAQLQIRNLLTAIAVLKAEKEGTSAACALITSSQSVAVGEPFLLLWSSYGATDATVNAWAPSGAFTIVIDKPGIRQYKLDFFGNNGYKTTCTALISVHQ